MKKIILILGLLFITQSFVFADEVIDNKGNITPCKIVTVNDGFIEYQKDGCLYNFKRESGQKVFNDYVDVRTVVDKKQIIERQSGNIILKDFSGVRINTDKGDISIPWYRVKFVGVYKPD